GIQALRYGRSRWTVQFHPEMDHELARVAGAVAGVGEEAWTGLDTAVSGGRAIVRAWVATL
ncbi:MAG: hypothetical protein ACK4YP_06210, partial [Myxococcota bacterium]